MYKAFVKRIVDLFFSVVGIILLFPFFLLITIILLIANNGGAFFCQKRPGLNGKIFKIIKFRTMNDKKDSNGNMLPDAKRLTVIGSFVRKTSLDELPQLFNVLMGDMSLIGPRPLMPQYLPLYSITQSRRHEVRPGITGWAQVNGRNAIAWTKKLEHDIYYVAHLSFALDLKILWITLIKVISRHGVNQAEDRPMNPFTGSN